MVTTSSTTLQPVESAKETILGMNLSLEQRFGLTPRLDADTTLNSKFGVFPTQLPTGNRPVQYFCMGVGGRMNDTSSVPALVSAQYVLGTNMAPYAIRPFRAVLLAQDLSLAEMANYAMRQVTTINGELYALYYLKKIVFSSSETQFIETDPTSGVVTDYDINYSNLSPTPPVADSNGVVTDIADQISIVVPGTLLITGAEMLESNAAIDGGDTRLAVVSELGLVSAQSVMVTATDVNGLPFQYEEAIFAQMTNHYTWTGNPLLSTSDTFQKTMSFSVTNLLTS